MSKKRLSPRDRIDLVLGQHDFTTRDEGAGAGLDAVGMRWPHAIAVAGEHLFVADAGSSRIMVWRGLPQGNGLPCDFVLGQPDSASGDHNRSIVNLVDQPVEYAMLQNNLGNALQYASSRHAVENNRRALAAYDEALRVRSRATMPVEYANTLANKANCLWNLPDDGNLIEARALYEEARDIFLVHGEAGKAAALAEALAELDRECAATDRGQRSVLS